MKVCPRCQKTYADNELNFCLDDGATLAAAQTVGNAVPATLILNQPRPTEPPFAGGQTGNANNWNNPNQMTPAPKKSKAWLWAVGIIGVVILLCGGGLTGLVFYAANQEKNNRNTNSASVSDGKQKSPTPYDRTLSEKNPVSTDRTNVQKIDLAKWADGETEMGATEFKNDELLLSSAKKNYYYVLASSTVYKTEDAATKVTVRNVNNTASRLGYGLVVHSNPVPLKQDYAFLIDSVNKKYRVVRHKPGEEIVVAAWVRSSAIKDGGESNTLEVRDQNKKMNFYINGEFVKTIDNADGFDGGVTGLYSGDAVKIAFSNLEISK